MFRVVRRDHFLPMVSLFDEFIKDSITDEIRDRQGQEHVSAMALDLTETEKEYRVLANLPGVSKDDVKLSIDKKTLTIEVTQQFEKEDDQIIYHHRERFSGKYHRVIHLPENVDTNAIKAKMENGVLELTIPKEEKKPQILINVE